MVKISNPTIIGITETKIDNSINDSEISSNGYCANWRNRNRKAGGAVSLLRDLYDLLQTE